MIIDCDQHDWVEIYCLRKQQLLLQLHDGTALIVRAVTTSNTAGQECLVCDSAGQAQAIPLLAIASIQALDADGRPDGAVTRLKTQAAWGDGPAES